MTVGTHSARVSVFGSVQTDPGPLQIRGLQQAGTMTSAGAYMHAVLGCLDNFAGGPRAPRGSHVYALHCTLTKVVGYKASELVLLVYICMCVLFLAVHLLMPFPRLVPHCNTQPEIILP